MIFLESMVTPGSTDQTMPTALVGSRGKVLVVVQGQSSWKLWDILKRHVHPE